MLGNLGCKNKRLFTPQLCGVLSPAHIAAQHFYSKAFCPHALCRLMVAWRGGKFVRRQAVARRDFEMRVTMRPRDASRREKGRRQECAAQGCIQESAAAWTAIFPDDQKRCGRLLGGRAGRAQPGLGTGRGGDVTGPRSSLISARTPLPAPDAGRRARPTHWDRTATDVLQSGNRSPTTAGCRRPGCRE